MKPETLAVHAGYTPDPTTRSSAVPIYQTVAVETMLSPASAMVWMA